jgi:DNA polymerase elongation subunit (family B)
LRNEFYTNVALHRNELLVCGYLDGKRYLNRVRYKPYLFVPSRSNFPAEYKTLQNKPVEKLEFEDIRAVRKFLQDYSDVDGFKIYGLTQFVYTYIYDNFPGEVNYQASQIQVHNLDIECLKNDQGRFASVELADGQISLIGIGIKDERIVFGWKENYTTKNKNHRFIKCKDEIDMLQKFINFWSHADYRPDVITGWYCEKYDVPMLIHRIRRLLGDEEAKRLSPWGILKEKTIEVRGKEIQVFEPVGVTILDYFDLYRKFNQNQQESYTLDHIAFVETGKRKLDYSEFGSLDELYEANFEKYVDYNITDIDRVADIDSKNGFLELVFTMAYDAKVNFIDALTSVRLWDVIIHNHLMDKKTVIPDSMKTEFMAIPGGYVKEPQSGLHDWVVSFDLQSLYPHLIMQYNISPETFVKITPWTEKNVQKVLDGDFKAEGEYAQAANGALFAKDRMGFLPELMKLQFQKRAEYKKKMLDLEKNHPDETSEIKKYYNWQWAKKIQLNSAYGAIANEYCRWYDWRLASAITLSGQLSVRWVEKALNEFLNYLLGTNKVDYVIAMDTDSCYLNLSKVVDFVRNKKTDKQELIDYVDGVCKNNLQSIINKAFTQLAITMNAYENAMVMKRESIADKALWKEKKHYIMNVWDKEGVRYTSPELKIMGIEVAKSIIPGSCRTALKEAISLIMNSDEDSVQKYITEFKKKFDNFGFEDIAFPRGVNGITKYLDPVTLWKKGSPVHVKGAIVYNRLLKDKKLDHRYAEIFDKDKIRFCYLKMPNPSQSPVIAAPRDLPKEFNLDAYIDRELMFEKTFLAPLQSILNVIGWKHEETNSLENFFN